MTDTLRCPECGSDQVLVYEETAFMVNSYEFYCHSVKAHDSDAKTCCLECNWQGLRSHLVAHNVQNSTAE